jgi:hypothetical protein
VNEGKNRLTSLDHEMLYHQRGDPDVTYKFNWSEWTTVQGSSNSPMNYFDRGVFVCAHMMLFAMRHQFTLLITTVTAKNFRAFLSFSVFRKMFSIRWGHALYVVHGTQKFQKVRQSSARNAVSDAIVSVLQMNNLNLDNHKFVISVVKRC